MYVNSITIDIYCINLLTYYVSSIMYYINIVIDYSKRYILIIILIVYNITKTEHMYPLKHSLETALSNLPQECVHLFHVHDQVHKTATCCTKNAACYILWQHRSIRLVSHETHRLSVRGNMDTPMRERRICD